MIYICIHSSMYTCFLFFWKQGGHESTYVAVFAPRKITSADCRRPTNAGPRASSQTFWQANSSGVVPPGAEPVPLSPRLKTLLELKAQDAVTSLSILYVPETGTAAVAPVSATSRADSAGPTAAAAAATATQVIERYNARVDGGSPDAGLSKPDSATEQLEAPSAAGVYVSVGLETGAVEVMRLSIRRAGTRAFNLVSASGRSDRMSSSSAAGSRPVNSDSPAVDGEPSGDGIISGRGGGDYDPNERLRGEELASAAAVAATVEVVEGESSTAAVASGGTIGEGLAARLRLDRGDSGLPEPEILRAAAAAASVLGGWHVPADCNGYDSWKGRGLVVGFSDTGLGTAPFAATPQTPLDRTFGAAAAAPRWGWGKATGESVSGRSGSRAGGGNEQQPVFAVCTMDGCVRCCQVVSTAEGQPQWKQLWTRQTKARELFLSE